MVLGRLTITPPLGETAVVNLDSPEIILGRSNDAGLTLADPLASQQHARIFSNENGTWIEDLGSTNGTFVNGLRLTPGIPVPLTNGSRIELGDSLLQFAAVQTAAEATLITKSPADSTLLTRPEAKPGSGLFGRYWFIGLLALIGLAAVIAAILLWRRQAPSPTGSKSNQSESATPTNLPPPAVSRAQIAPCQELVMPVSSAAVSIGISPSPPAIPLLDLPFPYDGGNENFGGTAVQFRRAVQRSASGGRINSFFDHYYPLYPAPTNPAETFGKEPAEPPIAGNILLFDGQLSAEDYYSGHPAYDFSTFAARQPTTPVFAAADGVVYDVGKHTSGALYVKLEHAVSGTGNFLTIYWHLHPDGFFASMEGQIGEKVAAGTRIGTMGNTGWSTGHHLHFEVRFDRNGDGLYTADESVDPFGFIPSPAYPSDPWSESSRFTDGRGASYNHQASISPYLWVHRLGTAAQVPEAGSGLLPLAAAPDEATGKLCAPAGSLPPDGTMFWSYTPDPPDTANLAGVGEGCVLSVFDTAGSPIDSFIAPVRVELPFYPDDYAHLEPDSLAIYWQDAGSSSWISLPTTFDEEQGIAAAETSRPGRCALLGRPGQDRLPPRTAIEVAGERGVDGAWFDEVRVSARSSDTSGIAKIEYSLDAGTTWLPYTGPITLLANGLPDPLPDQMEEDFGSGPGRFLVLFSATDAAGNIEDPPAFRRIVIDPSKAPPPEISPTPTFSPTPSPTVCLPQVTAKINANVRWGPGLIYDPPVAALRTGESALISGKTSDGSWWKIDLGDGARAQYWVADSVVSVNCGGETIAVVATPVPPTSTPTPTNTPTTTPTSTPTMTPTPTSTRLFDQVPPSVTVSHNPDVVFETNQITFIASAKDNTLVARIEIWVMPPGADVMTKMQTCLNTDSCLFVGGPYNPGNLTYIAYAWDPSNNQGNSGLKNVTILSVPK